MNFGLYQPPPPPLPPPQRQFFYNTPERFPPPPPEFFFQNFQSRIPEELYHLSSRIQDEHFNNFYNELPYPIHQDRYINYPVHDNVVQYINQHRVDKPVASYAGQGQKISDLLMMKEFLAKAPEPVAKDCINEVTTEKPKTEIVSEQPKETTTEKIDEKNVATSMNLDQRFGTTEFIPTEIPEDVSTEIVGEEKFDATLSTIESLETTTNV